METVLLYDYVEFAWPCGPYYFYPPPGYLPYYIKPRSSNKDDDADGQAGTSSPSVMRRRPSKDTEINAPTVLPFKDFNAENDCEALREAMKGAGTEEDQLIEILCKRSWQQRLEIAKNYQQLFGRDLEEHIKEETSGHFTRVLKRLLKEPIELAAYELYKGTAGSGTNEDALIEVFCTRRNDELAAIAEKYKEMFGTTLEEDINSDTSGLFRRLLVSLLSGSRPDEKASGGAIDFSAAATDARALFEKKKKDDEDDVFNLIFAGRNYSQLRVIFDTYQHEYKEDIVDVVKSEFSGDIEKAFLAIVSVARNRLGYFASRLHEAMDGVGCNEDTLLRIIVGHCDFDLAAIKANYQKMYGRSLYKAVKDETSGDFKHALLALIGEQEN